MADDEQEKIRKALKEIHSRLADDAPDEGGDHTKTEILASGSLDKDGNPVFSDPSSAMMISRELGLAAAATLEYFKGLSNTSKHKAHAPQGVLEAVERFDELAHVLREGKIIICFDPPSSEIQRLYDKEINKRKN